MAIENQLLPAGVNTQVLDDSIKVNYLLENQHSAPKAIISNSFGFGGSNCSLLLEKK